MRILYIQATLVPPPTGGDEDRFVALSEEIEGDILQPVWFRSPEEIEAIFGAGSYPVYTVGRFRYHWYPAYKGQHEKSRLAIFWFYLTKGFRICRERKIDCIVVYSHMTTALCGVVLKFLTGTKLIPELMIAPERAYLTDRAQPSLRDKLKHFYSTVCLYISVLSCNRVHLLYPRQLAQYPLLRSRPATAFHDYTPVSRIQQHTQDDANSPYIVLAGSPWFRKGADLAVNAFERLAADFPAVRLKIVGHFPEGTLQAIASGCAQIDVIPAKSHDELMRMLADAIIMILPSRNEGLPRILIEGMMAALPVVGSDVAGIPELIRHGENGFVVPDGDVPMLEQRLRELLSNPALRQRMGRRSYELARATLTESVYRERFVQMLRDTIG